MIYLDHNATTPPHPKILRAMAECAGRHWANPASQHRAGQEARRRLNEVRQAVAQWLGARPNDGLVWTSGGTEANNLALRGLAGRPPGKILVSAIEHPSVLQTAQFLAHSGFDVQLIPVDRTGVVDLDRLAELLDADVRLISVMLANHETGVLQPVQQVAEMARPWGIPVHTDAVQAVGKVGVNFAQLGVSAMTVCAHKLHGPTGIGALVLQAQTVPQAILYGGPQQLGVRPGTESVPLAVGFQAALRQAFVDWPDLPRRMEELRDRFEARVAAACQAIIVGGQSPRTPHTSNMAFPGKDRQMLLLQLDQAGIACSTGSACASGSSQPSPVLLAMQCEPAVVRSSLRFSLGAFTTAEEIDTAAATVARVVNG